MRILLFVFLIVAGFRSWGFQYQIDSQSLLRPSMLKAQRLSQVFESHGLWSVRGASFVRAGMPFDFVYVNQSWDKTLLIKEGLIAPAEKMGVIFRDEALGASLFHFQLDGSSYVVMALGFNPAELREMLAPFTPRATSARWSLLMNSAYAMDTVCDPQNQSQGTIAESAAGLDDGLILRTIGKCGADAWEGMKKSADDTVGFFKKLATDPGALWSEMKDSFVQLKEFALNIKSEMKSFLDQIQNMPTEQKMQVVCSMTGGLLVKAAVGAVSAAALARTLPLLIVQLRKSMALLTKLAEVRKRTPHNMNLNYATKEILSCAY